jgi:hypothetical protein
VTEIENGGQPISQGQWQKAVRGSAVVHKLKANFSTFSDKFLEDHLQGRAQ